MNPDLHPDLTIVLLGKAGVGKSASGNTILGRPAFESELALKSVTEEISEQKGNVCGKQISVVDTPGILDSKDKEKKIKSCCQELLQSSRRCLFLVVLRVGWFTKEDQEAVKAAVRVLGPRGLKESYLLFTGGDVLQYMSLDDFIFQGKDNLQNVVKMFAGAYHLFNNEDDDEEQVRELLLKSGHLTTQQQPDPPADVSRDRRVMLFSLPGAGKSASGNTILGSDQFKSDGGFDSVSTEMVSKSAVVEGRKVTVVDTPGFTDEVLTREQLYLEIMKSIVEASPGPHAFIIVVRIGRITKADVILFELLLKLFEGGADRYSMVLFTHGDQLKGKSIEDEIQSNRVLSELVSMCGGRYCVFDNGAKRSREQVRNLLNQIDEMVTENGGEHYTDEMFRMAKTFFKEEWNRSGGSDDNVEKNEWKRIKRYLLLGAGIGLSAGPLAAVGALAVAVAGAGAIVGAGAGAGAIVGAVAGAGADEEQVRDLLLKSGHLPTHQQPDVPADVSRDRRVVLFGLPGSGKSASGNTILRSYQFKSDGGFDSVSTETVSKSAVVEGRKVTVVDTPGFTDEVLTPKQLYKEIMKPIVEASPGPHAFVIVVRIGRISKADVILFELLLKLFEGGADRYFMVLFTHGDQLKDKSIEDKIKSNKLVSDLVSMCGGRYCVFDNRAKRSREQVRNLLNQIDEMVTENGGEHYTDEMFRMAKTFFKEEMNRSDSSDDKVEEMNRSGGSDDKVEEMNRSGGGDDKVKGPVAGTGAGKVAKAVAVVGAVAGLFAGLFALAGAGAGAGLLVFAGAVVGAVIAAVAGAVVIWRAVAEVKALVRAGAGAVAGAGAGAVAGAGAGAVAGAVAGAGTIAGAVAGAGAGVLAGAVAGEGKGAGTGAVLGAGAGAIAGALAGAGAETGKGAVAGAVAVAGAGAVAGTIAVAGAGRVAGPITRAVARSVAKKVAGAVARAGEGAGAGARGGAVVKKGAGAV